MGLAQGYTAGGHQRPDSHSGLSASKSRGSVPLCFFISLHPSLLFEKTCPSCLTCLPNPVNPFPHLPAPTNHHERKWLANFFTRILVKYLGPAAHIHAVIRNTVPWLSMPALDLGLTSHSSPVPTRNAHYVISALLMKVVL